MQFENVSRPIAQQKAYRCPCCGFKTLYGRGHDEICPVCFWEDDGQDEQDADEVRGGTKWAAPSVLVALERKSTTR